MNETLKLTNDSKGMRRARRALRQIAKFGTDPSEFFEAAGQTLVEAAVNRLAVTNKSPDGTPWPESLRAKFDGGRTQFDTGMAGLAGSLTYRVLPGLVEVGSPLIYAAQRQFGGTIKAKTAKGLSFGARDQTTGAPTMGVNEDGEAEQERVVVSSVTQPARPYLGISDDDADELAELALEFLASIVDENAGAAQ